MRSFFQELKRRHVIRVAAIYIPLGWFLAEVAGFAADTFGAPGWFVQMFSILILHYLDQHEDVQFRHLYRKLNLFTNDMDISRGQSFEKTHGELFALIRKDGYRWSWETVHAQVAQPLSA